MTRVYRNTAATQRGAGRTGGGHGGGGPSATPRAGPRRGDPPRCRDASRAPKRPADGRPGGGPALLRDFRTGEEHAIDPGLFDILYRLREATGTKEPFQVISGYRSPVTNSRLRQAGRGVAKRSLHMDGMAIDVRLSDVRSSVLRDAALELARGGVGYYRKSDFVRVDTGRVRRW